MSNHSPQNSIENIEIKQFGLALIGVCLAYILAAVFLYFFMNFYAISAANVKPLLVNGRWPDSTYDSLPVKVFFGVVFITAPILAYALARMQKAAQFFSWLHFLGILLLLIPLTWGIGRILLYPGDNSGLFIIIACVGYLFLLLWMPSRGLLHDVFSILRQRLNNLNLSKVQIASIVMGIALVGLGWGGFMIAFDSDTPVAGTRIGVIMVLMLIGLILAISQGYEYLKQKLHLSQKAQQGAGFFADGLVWLTIALCLLPPDLVEVTRNIFPDPHLILYFLGPALFHAYGSGFVPGLDYYAQYSLGAGPLFAPLIADTLFATYSRYILFSLAFIIIFYGTVYHLLRGIFRSRTWAFAITFTILTINFTTKTWLAAPSTLPYRYPLLPLYAWVLAKALDRGLDRNSVFMNIGVGLSIGLSLIANTETGIYMFAAAIGGYFLYHQFDNNFWWKSAMTGISALISFLLICFLLFGKGIFTQRFYTGIFEAVLAFGTGFGDFPMVWGELQSVLYNTAAPMISLATIGWVAAKKRDNLQDVAPRQFAYLTIFSLLSIAFSLKYLNRSFQQTWLVSSINMIIIMAWWLQYFLKRIFAVCLGNDKRKSNGGQGPGYIIASSSLAVFTLLFFSYASVNIGNPPVREDAPLGINAFGYWPSLAKSIFSKNHPSIFENEPRNDFNEPAQGDIDLITRLTNPGDSTTVFSDYDYAYYYAAQRAPQFGFIPDKWTLFDYYIDRWVAMKANPVFVESVPELIAPDVNPVLMGNYLSYRSFPDGELSAFLLFEQGDEITYTPTTQGTVNEDANLEPGKLSVTDYLLGGTILQESAAHYSPTENTPTYMTRGPLIDLPPGQYEVVYWLRIDGSNVIKPVVRISVTSAEEGLLKQSEISMREFQSPDKYYPITISINLPARLKEVEFLVTPLAKVKMELQKIQLTHIAEED